jgi:hypothetical protein
MGPKPAFETWLLGFIAIFRPAALVNVLLLCALAVFLRAWFDVNSTHAGDLS